MFSDVYDPFVVLAIGVAFIVFGIVFLRLHAFLALILAAIIVGILSPRDLPADAVKSTFQPVQAFELATIEFGNTAGGIGVVIVLASIIGKCLMDSGAADKITRTLLSFLSEKLSGLALMGSGYVLSIPVFFDTVFYLLVPLAKALRLRTGKNYILYILCICAGGVMTHSLVAPTPGPLIMADNLNLDLGVTILAGVVYSIVPALVGGWLFAIWVNRRMEIPLREVEGSSLDELREIVEKPDHELPPFVLSILPIVLPVLMITGDTIIGTVHTSLVRGGGDGLPQIVRDLAALIGNKNLALFVSTALALWLYITHKRIPLRNLARELEPAIASAGVIILITSAGGAFGKMVGHIGVAQSIETLFAGDTPPAVLLLVAYFVAVIMKCAQGSGTVSMITSSTIMWGVIGTGGTDGEPPRLTIDLPFHPVFIFLAIGFGSKAVSWMNDSGFWIVSKMSGLTEKETLKTWTPLLIALSVVGIIQILIAAHIDILNLNFLDSLPGPGDAEPPGAPTGDPGN